nr:hypothetical protein [Actinokineospora pegani]
MATWDEVKQWRADAVGQVGDHLVAQRNLVVGLQDELDGGKPAGWAGQAAEAADNDLRARRQSLEELAARLSAAVKVIDDTEQSVREPALRVEATEDQAVRNGLRIVNGEVVEAEEGAGLLDVVALRIEVQAVLAQATAVDSELDSALQGIRSGEIDDAGATTLAEQAGFAKEEVTEAEAAMLDDLQAREGAPGPQGVRRPPAGRAARGGGQVRGQGPDRRARGRLPARPLERADGAAVRRGVGGGVRHRPRARPRQALSEAGPVLTCA